MRTCTREVVQRGRGVRGVPTLPWAWLPETGNLGYLSRCGVQRVAREHRYMSGAIPRGYEHLSQRRQTFLELITIPLLPMQHQNSIRTGHRAGVWIEPWCCARCGVRPGGSVGRMSELGPRHQSYMHRSKYMWGSKILLYGCLNDMGSEQQKLFSLLIQCNGTTKAKQKRSSR